MQHQEKISWVFHVDGQSKTSNTNNMINRYDLGELGIIINFNDKTVTSDTDIIPMKERGSLIPRTPLLKFIYQKMNLKVLWTSFQNPL
jgi:hypothetical protein